MIVYNQNTDKIENIKVYRDSNGSHYITKLSIIKLNELGLYPLKHGGVPSRRYYTSTSIKTIVGNYYEINHTVIDKDIATIKKAMFKDLKETFEAETKRPRVMTTMGYAVDGSRVDLENFTIGREFGFPLIIDADDITHNATPGDYDQVILAIKSKGIDSFILYRTKKEEIKALLTVSECILYESTPYTYTITAEDVANDIDSSLVEGTVVTRYKNNVKDW